MVRSVKEVEVTLRDLPEVMLGVAAAPSMLVTPVTLPIRLVDGTESNQRMVEFHLGASPQFRRARRHPRQFREPTVAQRIQHDFVGPVERPEPNRIADNVVPHRLVPGTPTNTRGRPCPAAGCPAATLCPAVASTRALPPAAGQARTRPEETRWDQHRRERHRRRRPPVGTASRSAGASSTGMHRPTGAAFRRLGGSALSHRPSRGQSLGDAMATPRFDAATRPLRQAARVGERVPGPSDHTATGFP